MITTEIVPDDVALRTARRARLLAEMEAADVDVLVVGREANARYISGVPRLWLAGTRPYGPGCILVRATGAVHLLTSWDEGVPDDIPREHLIGFTFNPGNQVKALRAIEGSAGFRTVATDAMNHMVSSMLPRAFPNATIVDAGPLLQRARSVKTEAEVEAIRTAVAIGARCIETASRVIAPGMPVAEVTAAFMEEMARSGICMPSVQDVVRRARRDDPTRYVSRDVPLADGDVVALTAGVMVDGYAGDLTRSIVVGGDGQGRRLVGLAEKLLGLLEAAVRPGAPLSALLEVYADAPTDAPIGPIAHGLGLGFDHPTVLATLGDSAAAQTFEEGMVLAVTARFAEPGVGAAELTEPLLVTADGAVSLAPPVTVG